MSSRARVVGTLVGSTDLELSAPTSPTLGAVWENNTVNTMENATPCSSASAAEGRMISNEPADCSKAGQETPLRMEAPNPLMYRLGRMPGPTVTFTAPSPSSSDDLWAEPDIRLEDNVTKSNVAHSPKPHSSFKPLSMWSSENFSMERSGDKDHDLEGEASHFPIFTGHLSESKNNRHFEHHARKYCNIHPPASKTLIATDLNNRFKGLKIETAAPCEEVNWDDQKTLGIKPLKRNRTFSFNFGNANDSMDFPALPHVTPSRSKGPAADTAKPKIISIGIPAVSLVDARAKSSKKKSARPLKIENRSTTVTNNDAGAWKTVENGKRRS